MAPTSLVVIYALLLAALTGPSAGEPYLVGHPQGVTPRDETVQGWALVENLCPDGTGTCGKRSCCPIGSYCDDNEATNSNLCCPTNQGCAYDVSKADRCAVSTWVEWYTINDPICCLPGEIGVQPGPHDYYGYCSSAGSNVPSSLLASTSHSPSTAAATSQSTLASSPATESAPTAAATTSQESAAASTPNTSAGPASSATAGTNQGGTSSAANPTPSKATANLSASSQGGLVYILSIIGTIIGFLVV